MSLRVLQSPGASRGDLPGGLGRCTRGSRKSASPEAQESEWHHVVSLQSYGSPGNLSPGRRRWLSPLKQSQVTPPLLSGWTLVAWTVPAHTAEEDSPCDLGSLRGSLISCPQCPPSGTRLVQKHPHRHPERMLPLLSGHP